MCVCVCVCVCVREENVLFNNGLYDVGHIIRDHSDNERGNPLPPRGSTIGDRSDD